MLLCLVYCLQKQHELKARCSCSPLAAANMGATITRKGMWGITHCNCIRDSVQTVPVLFQVEKLVQQRERPLPVRSCSGMAKNLRSCRKSPCAGPSAQALMAAPMETGSADCTSKTTLPQKSQTGARPENLLGGSRVVISGVISPLI